MMKCRVISTATAKALAALVIGAASAAVSAQTAPLQVVQTPQAAQNNVPVFTPKAAPSPAQTPQSFTKQLLSGIPQITDLVPLPDAPYNAVQNKDGTVIFLSSTGRYLIAGKIIDVWSKKTLNTVSEMRYAFGRVNLEGIGIKTAELQPILLGTGNKRVRIFVDPQCSWCDKLLTEIRGDESLQKDYVFEILVIPALGEASARISKALYCAQDQTPEFLLNTLHTRTGAAVPQKPNCDTGTLDKRYIAAQMLGIQSVPFLIAPDGRTGTGKPQDLRAWLQQGEAEFKAEELRWKNAIKQAAETMAKSAEKAAEQLDKEEAAKEQEKEKAKAGLPLSQQIPVPTLTKSLADKVADIDKAKK